VFTVRARLSGVLVVTGLIGGGLLVAAPAAAAPVPGFACVVEAPFAGAPAAFQPLRVCASFDKASYSAGDVVKLTVSATNIGTATAPGVALLQLETSGSDEWTGNPVGPLISTGTGEDLPAGETFVSEVDGYASDPASGLVTFSGSVDQFLPDGTGDTFGDPVSISSSVTPATGDYSGVVFTDGNGSGQPDAGEGLAGAQVTLTGPSNGINGSPAQTFTATSDAQGDFRLTGLPAGRYTVNATGPTGWFVRPGPDAQATVDSGSGASPVLFPATPDPFPLRATATFDKTSYQAGDTAEITFALTNTSGSDLHGVQAQCNPSGDAAGLWGIGAGWDVLAAPGVTVPAGQTSTLHLSEIVPAVAVGGITGKVFLDCIFGPNPGFELDGLPVASASAAVSAPANPVSFTVNLVDDDPLGGVPGPTCAFDLLDPASQDPVLYPLGVQSVSNLPPGTYDIDIASGNCGFSLAPGQPTVLNTADITNGRTVDVHVVPTKAVAPPAPPVAAVLSVDQENPENPLQVAASGLMSSSAQPIDSYSFDFGDGTAATSNVTGLATHTYAEAGTYTVTLTDHDAGGNTASATRQVVIGSPFVPLSPVRLLDTRSGIGAPKAKVGAGGQISLAVTGGTSGIPADGSTTAVVLNVTVTSPTSTSFLTVYPDGHARPATSNLNFTSGQTIPNLVTVPVGADGRVDFFNHVGSVDVIADVEGYYRTAATPEGGNRFQAGYLVGQAPHRLLDTRDGTGAPTAPLTGGRPLTVNVLSAAGVPQGVPIRAVVLNVTATGPSGAGNLVVYPDNSAPPAASNLNFTAGETIANSVIVPVPADGGIDFLNHAGTVQVLADVQGYYTGGAGGAFVPGPPTRLLDTRSSGGAIRANGTRTLQVAGATGVPDDASAVVLNTTVTDGTANSFVTVFPDGSPLPTASDINFAAGETIPNMVTAGIGADGKVDFFNHVGSVDVLADLFGYFTRT
jgi:PKD repeat protein